MLSKRTMDVLEVEDEKSATDPIHFEETLTFSVLCSCRLSQIGIQKMTGKPWGTHIPLGVGCKNSSEHKLLGQKRIHPD